MAIIRKIVRKLVLPVGAIVSVPLVVPLIYADESQPDGKRIAPKDLPIYDPPKDTAPGHPEVQGPPSFFEKGVSGIRKSFFTRLDSFDETKQQALNFLEKGRTYTLDAIRYVREENNVVPRAILITVSGLGGLLAGARGGFFKKVIYSSTGIVVMSSICYPQQAVQISQDAYKIGKYYSIITYNKIQQQRSDQLDRSSSEMDEMADKMSDVQWYGFRIEDRKEKDSIQSETNSAMVVKDCSGTCVHQTSSCDDKPKTQ